MLKTNLLVAALAVSFSALALPALADQPGADWITQAQAIAKLKAAGYTSVTKIEADDGHWEGEGIKDGKNYEFHVDPHTGKVTKSERDNDHDGDHDSDHHDD